MMPETLVAEPLDTGIDENGRFVIDFESKARNLSKIGLLHELIAEMFKSGKWREYQTGTGREKWLECEFDYFLISTEIRYNDACDVFRWTGLGPDLVRATSCEPPDSTKRRPIAEASKAWNSGSGTRWSKPLNVLAG